MELNNTEKSHRSLILLPLTILNENNNDYDNDPNKKCKGELLDKGMKHFNNITHVIINIVPRSLCDSPFRCHYNDSTIHTEEKQRSSRERGWWNCFFIVLYQTDWEKGNNHIHKQFRADVVNNGKLRGASIVVV